MRLFVLEEQLATIVDTIDAKLSVWGKQNNQ
jgi:hypothetical protein